MYKMRPGQMLQTLAAGIVESLIPNLSEEVRPHANSIAAVLRHLSIGLPILHVLLARENREILDILTHSVGAFSAQGVMPVPDGWEELRAEIEHLFERAESAEYDVELHSALKTSLVRLIGLVDLAKDSASRDDVAELNARINRYLRGQIDRDLAFYDAAFIKGWRSLRTATPPAVRSI